jgi:hypothetical protein
VKALFASSAAPMHGMTGAADLINQEGMTSHTEIERVGFDDSLLV